MEGEVGNHLYQSAASADDLLLTPAPLQSPMSRCHYDEIIVFVFCFVIEVYVHM